RLGLLAAPDLDQALGQVHRIVNTAIHAHSAERVVDMRGIADQEGAAAAECFGDALMYAIEGSVSDLVAIDARDDLRHQRLYEFRRQRQFIALLRCNPEHDAPEPGDL